MNEDDQDEAIPDDGDPRAPFLPPKPKRAKPVPYVPRKPTRHAVRDIDRIDSLADLDGLHHASRDRWRDPEIDP